MSGVLIAGIGNIFNGDDAFGVEVARHLARRKLPEGVTVRDFGIRGIDLVYALTDGFDAAILIDTAARGGAPGEVSVIEPERPADDIAPEDMMMSAHDLDPAKVLRVVAALGGGCRRIVLVACEPLTFGDEIDGYMGLSAPVEAAIGPAADMVERLASRLLEKEMAG